MNDFTSLNETLAYARETLARSNAKAQTADFERGELLRDVIEELGRVKV